MNRYANFIHLKIQLRKDLMSHLLSHLSCSISVVRITLINPCGSTLATVVGTVKM